MMDSFLQTRIHSDDIHKIAVSTPLGAYEWTVMPMGFRNSLPAQQCQVTDVLCVHLGKICHVYMDDIVIWSQSLEEHEANVRTVMKTLHTARLYMILFTYEISFLGHIISQKGICRSRFFQS